MTPEEYQAVQDLFIELRSLAKQELHERLRDLDADGHAYVGLLRELLEADQPDTFLESPFASIESLECDNTSTQGAIVSPTQRKEPESMDSSEPASMPDQIGPYRILQKIGEGGHGLVFMAEQRAPIRRKVAIKLVKPGMQSKMILARFAAERQALALMKHPSIANVIDAGTSEAGTPYFAMELVHGTPIDEFCLENQLSLDETLDLFCQVCDAVHHAHRKGIIHRDLKPANILVTLDSGKPLAKVIDFGIAKAMHLSLTDKTMFTEYGQIVGTLEYMSPEQAMLSQDDADVRSDVYSLGVILYLLLTGTTPISKQKLLERGLFELKNVLRDFRPPTPSLRLTSTSAAQTWKQMSERNHKNWHNCLKGDLDWITMKAISKELDLRYDSAAQLQSDIFNFRTNQPVVARPPTLMYRASKWINRNRIAAALLSCFFASAVISIISISWGAYQARKNLEQIEKTQKLLLDKAIVLESSLKETKIERERADKNASELALVSKKGLLESAWNLARDGNAAAAKEKLNLISVEHRDYLWELVDRSIENADSVTVRQAKRGAVRATDIHPATGRMAVATADSRLEIWSTNEGTLVTETSIPKALYSCLSFSQDGKKLLIGSSGWVIQYDLAKGEFSERIFHGRGGTRYAISDRKSGHWLVSTGANFLLEIDFESNGVSKSLLLPDRISSLELEGTGQRVAIASISGPVFLVDTNNFQITDTIKGLNAGALVIRWDQESLLAYDAYGAIYRLNPTQFNSSDNDPAPNATEVGVRLGREAVNDLATYNDSVFIVDQGGQLFFSEDKKTKLRISTSQTAIASILTDSNDEQIFLVRYDGRIDRLKQLAIQRQVRFSEHLKTLTDGVGLASSEIFVSSHHDGRILKVDQDNGLTLAERKVHEAVVFSMEVSEPNQALISLGADWTVSVCHLDSLAQLYRRKIALGVRDVAISHSGAMFASAADASRKQDMREGTIDLWETKTAIATKRFAGHTNWVTKMQFSKDDQSLYSLGLDATIRQWQVVDASNTLTIDLSTETTVTEFDLIESANRIICGHEDGSVSLKSTVDGSAISSAQIFFNSINGLVVSADDEVAFVTSAESDVITCLDIDTLGVICGLKMDSGSILGLKLDRSGQRLHVLNSSGEIDLIDLGGSAKTKSTG